MGECPLGFEEAQRIAPSWRSEPIATIARVLKIKRRLIHLGYAIDGNYSIPPDLARWMTLLETLESSHHGGQIPDS